MSQPIQDLVEQTRRLSRRRASSDSATSRRRCGEKTLETTRRTGGLPAPRLVEPETLADPPSPDLFDDFAIFGERISNLMTEAADRRSRRRHCSPFTTTRDCQVILRPRRSRSRDKSANEPRPQTPDHAANKLAGVGVAVFSLLVIAMIALSSTREQTESRAVARKPIPAESVEPIEIVSPEAPPTVIAGSFEEPSE